MKQPEALRLAQMQEDSAQAWKATHEAFQFRIDTANELRRLHEANDALLQSLKEVVDWFEIVGHESMMLNKAKRTISKANGEQA
jgi:hypothetical protein